MKFRVLLLLLVLNGCHGSRQSAKTSARALAKRTGATQFEERYESISSEEQKVHRVRKRASDEDVDYEVYQGVVGRPGIDFPIWPRIPQTTFSCRTFGNGYFADLETDCQVFHICEEGRKISFLCPNGTIFQQNELTCDWWFKVNCAGSPSFYAESSELLMRARNQRPSLPRKTFTITKGQPKHKSSYQNGKKHSTKTTDRRLDSNEQPPSVENFDFDDVSDENYSKSRPIKLKESSPSSRAVKEKDIELDADGKNPAELQIVAESASFVDSKRRNGYVYESPNHDRKLEEKTYEDRKGRGKFRYNGNRQFNANNNQDQSTEGSFSAESTTQQSVLNFRTNKPTSVPSFRTYTTARRLETTKTTPYYTPTIPSVVTVKTTLPANGLLKNHNDFVKDNSYSQILNTNQDKKETSTTRNYINHQGTSQPLDFSSKVLSTGAFSRFNPTTSSPSLPHTITPTYSTYSPKETTTNNPITTSTSGPTYLPESRTTPSTQPSKLKTSVTEHVKEMINTLNNLRNDLDTKNVNEDSDKMLRKGRVGLDIPPSSGPQTLISLASYFAGESNGSSTTEKVQVSVKPNVDITSSLLSNKTVGKYSSLFGLDTKRNEKSLETTTLSSINTSGNSSVGSKKNEKFTTSILGDLAKKSDTRKIARVFSNALSTYLENPDEFRKVLSEVRPTDPSTTTDFATESSEFTKINNIYNSESTTEFTPTSTIDSLESVESTTRISSRGTAKSINGNYITKVPFSAFNPTTQYPETTTVDENDIAVVINNQFDSSTLKPFSYSPTTSTIFPETTTYVSTTTYSPNKESSLNTELSYELLPPNQDSDDEFLQRAQSQSFVKSPNDLIKLSKQTTDRSKQSTTGRTNKSQQSQVSSKTDTKTYSIVTTENPWSHISQTVYLDPLTINDGLMNEFKTTTPSPFTYLPKSSNLQTTVRTPSHVHLNSKGLTNGNGKSSSGPKRISKFTLFSELPVEILPPTHGMQRIADKMFGGLNDSEADHLMNVMKKAENNSSVLRLILLLIQTCDDDNGKVLEKSRKALLDALITMDDKLQFEDEVEVIKLKPRRQKSISGSDSNGIFTVTTEKIPVTTYRRSLDLIATTPSPSPSSTSTDSTSVEQSTRFEIYVEDPNDYVSTTTTTESPTKTTTTNYPDRTTDVVSISSTTETDTQITTDRPLKRTAKDLKADLSIDDNTNTDSHTNSDHRALELLKSLYSLASKYGRRR